MRSLCSLTQDDNVEATERKNGNVSVPSVIFPQDV